MNEKTIQTTNTSTHIPSALIKGTSTSTDAKGKDRGGAE